MIFATASVETRVTRPVYFQSNTDDARMMVSVQSPGGGRVSNSPGLRIKVTHLASGDYSIKHIGAGPVHCWHVKGTAWMTLTTTDGSLAIVGTVADVFARAEKSTARRS